MPSYIEVGFHDYEASCENYFCNLVEATDDQLTCPPPPAPPPGKETVLNMPAIIGISAGAAAVSLASIACVLVMITKEKAGKPIFTNLAASKPGSSPGAQSV